MTFEDFYFVIEEPILLTMKGRIKINHKEICVLQSVLMYYNGKNKCFVHDHHPIFNKCKYLMIDSGGFNIDKLYGTYPFTIRDYHNHLERIKPDYAVSLDYNTNVPSLMEYEARVASMKTTINNFIEQFDMDRTYELILPIQGNGYEERLLFLDMLSQRIDLKKVEYWGVGGGGVKATTLRQQDNFLEIRRLLCDHLNKKFNNPKIHIFGGTLTFIKKMLKKDFHFTSLDTWSWGIPIKKGKTFDKNLNALLIRETDLSINEAKQRCVLRYQRDIDFVKRLVDRNNNVEKLL